MGKDGGAYFYALDKEHHNSSFRLLLLSSRALRVHKPSGICNLCAAKDRELAFYKWGSGFLTFNKYPVFERSLLFISYHHQNTWECDYLEDLTNFIRKNSIYLILSNMDGKCSVPDHFHLELINRRFFDISIINQVLSAIDPQKDIGYAKGYHVPFYYFNMDSQGFIQKYLEIYKYLKVLGYSFNVVMINNYLLVHLLKDVFSDFYDVSARAFLGVMSTSKYEDFIRMGEENLIEILKNSTLEDRLSPHKIFF